MTSANEYFSNTSDMLKAQDLKGREITVKIASFDVKHFDDGSKVIIKFQDKDKGLALNKTNGRRIAEAYGDEMEAWTGKEIILYPDKTDFNGSLVDCIRLRTPPVKAAEFDDDIPF